MIKNKRTRGFTLIEAVIAVGIVALALVPIVRGLYPAMEMPVKDKNNSIALFFAEYKMDETLKKLRSNYSFVVDTVTPGNFASEGYPLFKFTITTVEEVTGKLRQIEVLTWFDENNDDIVDSDEVQISLDCKAANRK